MYIPSTLIVPGDGAATVSNIIEHELLFRLSIVSALITQVIGIFVVLFLYKLLKPVNKNYAVLMVIFSLVGVPISMVNELNNVAVLILLSDSEYLSQFTPIQLQVLMSLFLELHQYGINIASIFWGLWLYPMGYLVFKSNYMPKLIGIFLIIGCFGYFIDFVAFFVFPSFDIVISEFTFLGEFMMIFWLLAKGINVEQWEQRAQESMNKHCV